MSILRVICAITIASVYILLTAWFTIDHPSETPRVAATVADDLHQALAGACTGTVSGTLSADTIRVCDTLSVTVGIKPVCPICPSGLNVVFVQLDKADIPQWMGSESNKAFNELHDLKANGQIVRVGVVHYNSQQVRKVVQITEDIESARGALSQSIVEHDPHGDFVGAARTALNMLRDANKDTPDGVEPCDIVIFFASTKSIYPDDGNNMLEAARMIRSQDVELFAGCPSYSNNDDFCDYTRQMASSVQNYTQANDSGKLARMITSYIDAQSQISIRDLYVTQVLPDGLQYVNGSANYSPARQGASGNNTVLDWEWKQIRSTKPQTLTYSIRPLTEGNWLLEGRLGVVDVKGRRTDVVMPALPITVTGLCLPNTPTPSPTPLPTDTPVPPTDLPTPTSRPTSTPSPTDSPSPTPTATPTPRALYLPLVLHERCLPEARRVDVILAIDASSSMTESTPAGRTKLAAAVDAARVFLDQLHFERGDQAAIVAFNAAATLLQPLTGDRAALDAALGGIQTAQQTCLVCAVDVAAIEITSPRHVPAHTPTIILLTDGRSNPRPASEAVARASEARAAGATIFTIGLGSDIEAEALTAIASRPEGYFAAPDAEALAGIYRQIAVDMPCPAGAFWGAR